MAIKRSYSAGHFMLSLDGEPALLKDFDGGNISAEVVTNKLGPDNVATKSISTLKFEPFTVNVGISMGKGLYEWIKASLDKAHIRKNGYIVSADYDYKAQQYRHFRDALITEVTFPALDAASKDSAFITVKFQAEEINYAKGDDAVLKGNLNAKQKKWLPSNFRVSLGDLPCAKVTKVDSFTIKQGTVEDPVGEFRVNQWAPTNMEYPNLKLTISSADIEPWMKWFDDFVIKGNNGQEKELQGQIEFLDPSRTKTLGSVQLMNCGIFKLTNEKLEADKSAVSRFVVELYCEKMAISIDEV
jgi:hypothetical protein